MSEKRGRDAGRPVRRARAPRPRATTRTLPWAASLALVLAAAVVVQFGALRAAFFADDFLFLDQVRFRSLPAVLAAPDPIANFFRPVSRQLWFWLLAGASRESPAAFHAANLVLFLVILTLLFALVRRTLGPRPALVGVTLLAVHHAADVPLLWACGSQDLLAVTGALAAILLFVKDRRWTASLALFAALLSKESVAVTPVIAALVARRADESWRRTATRAWPLFATLAAWAALWMLTLGRRPALAHEVHLSAAALPAAFAHLLQAAVGLEWPPRLRLALAIPPPALILALVAIVAGPTSSSEPAERRVDASSLGAAAVRATRDGVIWALLAALPVVAVADNWSAYYYLFALCGVALAVAGATATRPAWVGLLVALVLGWTSQQSRELQEFATGSGAWTTESHVNRHYLERGMTTAQDLLAELRERRPELPHRSTLFFGGLPIQVGFQTGDGPLVRWAYRDTSLRSYFFGQFRMANAERGPVFFFQANHGHLEELVGSDSLERVSGGLFLSEELVASRDVHLLALRVTPESFNIRYRLPWIQGALGDTAAMRLGLASCALPLVGGPTPEIADARRRVAAGDSATGRLVAWQGVLRHPLDHAAHSYLADLQVRRDDLLENAAIESFAARVLDPSDATAWKCWGVVQAAKGRPALALHSLERYVALAGPEARSDEPIQHLLVELRRRLPGGDVAQQDVHRTRPGGS